MFSFLFMLALLSFSQDSNIMITHMKIFLVSSVSPDKMKFKIRDLSTKSKFCGSALNLNFGIQNLNYSKKKLGTFLEQICSTLIAINPVFLILYDSKFGWSKFSPKIFQVLLRII